jgi:hypothetical protein
MIGNDLSIVGKILLEQCLIRVPKKSVWQWIFQAPPGDIAISYKQALQISDELAII